MPPADQTFENYYNEFSKYMTKFKTLAAPDTRRIAGLETAGGQGRGFRGRGRGSYGGRGRGRGQGCGRRGRGGQGRGYNPYSMSRGYGGSTFNPVAKIYSREEWYALTPQ